MYISYYCNIKATFILQAAVHPDPLHHGGGGDGLFLPHPSCLWLPGNGRHATKPLLRGKGHHGRTHISRLRKPSQSLICSPITQLGGC